MPLSSLSHTLNWTPDGAARNSSICSGECNYQFKNRQPQRQRAVRVQHPFKQHDRSFDSSFAQREPLMTRATAKASAASSARAAAMSPCP